MTENVETTSLRGLSERFSIPIWTVRKWASQRKFPGLLKKNRKIYVDIAKFRSWFYEDEIDFKDDVKK